MIFPLLEQIQSDLEELKSGLNVLREQLAHDDQLVVHGLTVIPYRTTGQDDYPEAITAEPVAEDESRDKVIDLICSINYKDDQHPKSTLRASGLVGVSSRVLEAIAHVNDLKKRFKDSVKQVPPRQRRVLNRHIPGLCRLQAYREIVALEGYPNAAHFFWASNKSGISRRSVATVRKELNTEKDKAAATDTSLLRAIEFDLEKLVSLPDREIVAKRRAIRLHPQCNLWVNSRLVGPEDAYLPIFYPHDAEKPCPDVTPLPSAEQRKRQRGLRSDRKLEDEPFLERIDLYRYLPEHRKFATE